ncbi:MAG TPA: AGE family epimerase/isomerase [Gemmatimonadaceae bacterium]|nr:AGE family epimerase/isomerase [Gemmatimonadaceae bacterium]
MPRSEDFERALHRHVLDVWFPRSLDREYGGFLCDFDRAWKPCGPHAKQLEFQARQTLLAADASRAYPTDARLREAAAHGFRFLREVIWDRECGGWYHRTERDGKPLESHTKHTHGFAYAISACVSVYEATGEPDALRLAQDAFRWVDQHAHDHDRGGYFGFLTREGRPVHTPADAPWTTVMDTLGTGVGVKDLNTHSDFLEGITLLCRAWPDPLVATRLTEMIDIIADRLVNPATGSSYFVVTPDWKPLPHLMWVGYQFHSAYRLMLAAGVAGQAERARTSAIRFVDHALSCALDEENGGFYYAVPATYPIALYGQDVRVKKKSWWVQTEALRGLTTVSRLVPGEPRYRDALEATWRYFERYFLDHRFGGVYPFGHDTLRRRQRELGARLAPAEFTRKGDSWKDASHEGRALLYCAEALRADPA